MLQCLLIQDNGLHLRAISITEHSSTLSFVHYTCNVLHISCIEPRALDNRGLGKEEFKHDRVGGKGRSKLRDAAEKIES